MAQPSDEYELVADLYDHVVPYRQRGDTGFFIEAARAAGGRVIEVGCGTGRVLIPTARAGVEITGIDLSPCMLAECRQRLAREPAEVQSRARLLEADMRDFSLPEKFRLATIPFRAFQHLSSVEDQLACLACIHRHLEPGGALILDIFNPWLEALTMPHGEEIEEEPEFTTPGGRRVIRKHRIVAHNRFEQVNRIELIYYVTHPDGRKERLVHAFDMRYLFRFEAEHLLARAGYTVEHVYADFEKNPYGSKYPGELIIVARSA